LYYRRGRDPDAGPLRDDRADERDLDPEPFAKDEDRKRPVHVPPIDARQRVRALADNGDALARSRLRLGTSPQTMAGEGKAMLSRSEGSSRRSPTRRTGWAGGCGSRAAA